MKLFYLANSAIPSRAANSVHVMRMCRAFAGLGLDVTLLTPESSEGAGTSTHDIFAYYGISPTFSLERIPWVMRRGRLFHYFRALRRHLREGRPDFAYGRDIFGVFAAASLGIPCALELHTPVSARLRPLRPLLRALNRFMYRRLSSSPHFKGTVVISHALKDAVLADTPYLNRKPVFVTHDGADDQGKVEPAETSSGKGRLRLGYVGHLYPGKGMEIISELAVRMPETDFHVIGGTPDDIQKWKAKLSVPNLIFHGHVPPAEVPSYQQAMDVLIAPYQRTVGVSGGGIDIAGYMSPLKLFEYMAAGKAIICSDLPVLREILDESCALIVPPDDIAAWIAAVEKSRDPVLRGMLGQSARERFLTHYTWDKRAEFIADALWHGIS